VPQHLLNFRDIGFVQQGAGAAVVRNECATSNPAMSIKRPFCVSFDFPDIHTPSGAWIARRVLLSSPGVHRKQLSIQAPGWKKIVYILAVASLFEVVDLSRRHCRMQRIADLGAL
jgi:hypothetical protein